MLASVYKLLSDPFVIIRSGIWGYFFFIGVNLHSQDLIHYTKDNGLPSDRVYMLTVDKDGFIWCATDKGVAMYNGERFTTYTTQNGMPINDMYKISATPDGKIW